jgi:hypothetical protein
MFIEKFHHPRHAVENYGSCHKAIEIFINRNDGEQNRAQRSEQVSGQAQLRMTQRGEEKQSADSMNLQECQIQDFAPVQPK